jgi:hypothetical protein
LTHERQGFTRAGVLMGAGIAAVALWFVLSREPESSLRAPSVADLSVKTEAFTSPVARPSIDGSAVHRSSSTDVARQDGWLERMSRSTDYYQLAQQAIDAAMAGDADAQFMLSLITDVCETARNWHALVARKPELAAAQVDVKDTRREKCMRWVSEPRLRSQSGMEVRNGDYWLDQAVEGGQPEALALHSRNAIARLRAEMTTAADHRELIESRLRSAAESANPRAYLYIGMALTMAAENANDSEDQRGIAWSLLACRLGGCGPELGPYQPACPEEGGGDCLSTIDRQVALLHQHLGAQRTAEIEQLVAQLREAIDSGRWSELDLHLPARKARP